MIRLEKGQMWAERHESSARMGVGEHKKINLYRKLIKKCQSVDVSTFSPPFSRLKVVGEFLVSIPIINGAKQHDEIFLEFSTGDSSLLKPAATR